MYINYHKIMIRGVNKYMVNRTVSGGGGNCKCVNGGSNGSSVNGGKITVEFVIYEVNADSENGFYITNEDTLKLRESVYNLYFANYTCTDYHCQLVTDETVVSYSNVVFQFNKLTKEDWHEYIAMKIVFQSDTTDPLLDFIDAYADGQLSNDMEADGLRLTGQRVTSINGNDPV